MFLQNDQTTTSIGSTDGSVRPALACQIAGMSPAQIPLTVRLLDGVVRPVAPLGPVWGAVVDPSGLRTLADVVSKSLDAPRLRESLAHWITEREDARKREAAKARTGARKQWRIRMPPRNAPAAAVYAAFARAAGSDSARRAAYRFGRLSVFAAERTVDELVDREYRRYRAGEHAARVARFEAQLELRDDEELDTLEKVHVVMCVRRAIANAPVVDDDDASNENLTNLLAEAAMSPEEADIDDPCAEHYWTPGIDESSMGVLKVVAASSLAALETLAEYFDPLRVGMALVTPKALSRFMSSVRGVVQGRSKKAEVLGKPEGPWFEELYAFSRCLEIVGPPDPAKQGARAKDESGRYRKVSSERAPRQLGHDFEAFRRKLVLGMDDLADEQPGSSHRLLDRLRDDPRPVYWSTEALRRRRMGYVEHARDRIRHVIDELPSGIPFSVAQVVDRSGERRSRVEEMIEEAIRAGRLTRIQRTE